MRPFLEVLSLKKKTNPGIILSCQVVTFKSGAEKEIMCNQGFTPVRASQVHPDLHIASEPLYASVENDRHGTLIR